MRRAIAVAALALAGREAQADAEHYEQIRVDGGLTASSVNTTERHGGGMVLEIKAMLDDHVAVGGRVEVGVMFGGVLGEDRLPMSVGMSACGLLKVEAYAGNGDVRPFAGLGAGGYTIGSQTISAGPNTGGIDTQTGQYFGVAPQLGVDLGPVRVAATYNAIVGASLELHETVGNAPPQTTHVSQNYFTLELSFQFAGGRKAAR